MTRLHIMNRLCALSFAILLAVGSLSAQQNSDSASSKPVTTVSFQLFHNRVYVPVSVNGRQTIEMVLDNGAAISGLSLETAQEVQLQIRGKAQLAGNGEARAKVKLAKDVTLRLGDVELRENQIVVASFHDLEAHEGRAIEGVLGVGLFRRYVVVIDYASRRLELYEPQGFVPPAGGEVIPLSFKGGTALFHASISLPEQEPIPVNLAIDSGTYSAVRLYHPFVEKRQLIGAMKNSADSFGFGIGGEFPEKLGHLDVLQIGSISLKKPSVSFSQASRGATVQDDIDGTIGGEVLGRFKVVVDFPHEQMVLQRGESFSKPFPADTSGLILQALRPDFKLISVLHVMPDTPAAQAGIREGDVILSVNHQEAAPLGLAGIRNFFTEPGAFHLQLQRDQQTFEIDMTTSRQLY